MSDRKTKKVFIEIYEDSEADFYLSLLEYKNSRSKNAALAKVICDSVKFDLKEIEQKVNVEQEERRSKIKINLSEVFKFLVKSGKYSGDYTAVAHANIEEYFRSGFIVELGALLELLELGELLKGRNESAEIKAIVYFTAKIFSESSKILREEFGNTISEKQSAAFVQAQLMQQPQTITINERGNQVYHFADSDETIEAEIYLENNGKVKKAPAELLKGEEVKIKGFDNITSWYMLMKGSGWHFKPAGDKIEMRPIQNIKVKKNKIDLTKSKFGALYITPVENFNSFRIRGSNDNYIVQQTMPLTESMAGIKRLEDSKSFIRRQSQKNKKPDGNQKNAEDKTTDKKLQDNTLDFFSSRLNNIISTLIKLDDGTIKKISVRDKKVLAVYGLIRKHYPDITLHVACAITGFICSQKGWLDSEEKYNESRRNSGYRKYLVDTIANTLKKYQKG